MTYSHDWTYTHHWECWACANKQESIDLPKMQVCEDCVRPVAAMLCHDALSVPLATEGVSEDYWMRKANRLMSAMFRRWHLNVVKEAPR